MKKIGFLTIGFLVLMSGLAFAAGGQDSAADDGAPSYTIILAHGASEDSLGNKAALMFKDLVEEKTDGKIMVDNFPAFQLGSIMELDQNVKSGAIQMVSGSIGGMTSRKLGVLDLPATYTDIEASKKVLEEGEFYNMVGDVLEESHLKLVSPITPIGFREISSNVAVRTVDDIKNLNIRTMEHPLHMFYWKALGANPTPIAFSELYVALQQGLVDAQENPFDTLISSKIYEQQKYVVLSHHVMFPNAFMMNLDFYNSLPAEYQTIITDSLKEVGDWQFEESKKLNAASIAKLQDLGLEVIELSSADYAKMAEMAKPVVDMVRADSGDAMVDTLFAELKAASK